MSSSNSRSHRLDATAEIVPGGALVMVGIGGRLAVVCAGAAMDAGLRHVSVAQATTAAREIVAVAPKVVVVPSAMDAAEKDEIRDAARTVGAEVVELAAVLAPNEVTHAVIRARAVADARQVRSSRASEVAPR